MFYVLQVLDATINISLASYKNHSFHSPNADSDRLCGGGFGGAT